jgi:hypothetical protein
MTKFNLTKSETPSGQGRGFQANTLSKRTTDFIAATARYASVNNGFNVLFVVLALQFVAMAWGVL